MIGALASKVVGWAGGPQAVFSSVLKGVGSIFSGRSRRKEARRQREHEERMVRMQGEETRRNQKEEALLSEWMRQNRRSEIARGSANFTEFAGSEFRNKQPVAAVSTRQVTPDEFISSGGLIGQLANQQPAPQTPPLVRP